MRPFRDSQPPSWLSGPRTAVPTEPLSHRPSIFSVLLFTAVYFQMVLPFYIKHYTVVTNTIIV